MTSLMRQAHSAVWSAIGTGALMRQFECERCSAKAGEPSRGANPWLPVVVCAHHADYAKPLEVEWLCRSCHTKHHHAERRARA